MAGRRGIVLLLVSMVALVACGRGPLRPAADGWLAVDADNVLYVRWTDNDGALSGSALVLSHDDDTVDAETVTLSGSRNGNRVSLTAKLGLGFEQTWHGKVSRTALDLDVPSRDGTLRTFRMKPADTQGYNAAADALRSRIEAQARVRAEASAAAAAANATAAAAQAAAAAVTAANEEVRRALADTQERTTELTADGLADEVSAYADAWATMQKDFAELQRLVRIKADCSEVSYQASAVSYARSAVEYQRTSFDYSREQVDGQVTRLSDAVTSLEAAYATLQAAVGEAPATATSNYPRGTIDEAVDAATARIAATRKTVTAAASKASDYDTKATQLDARASTLAESCSG